MMPFKRDRLTWLSYFMLAFFSYLQGALGPLMPFLRAELNLNYSVAALHASAFAVGMILAGLVADRAAARWGRRAVFWSGGVGMGIGGILLTLAASPVVTIASTFIMGFIGSTIVVLVPAILTDRYGARRAIALTESNVAASITAAIAPLVIGFGEASGIGWRLALFVGVGGWLILALIDRRTPIPESRRVAEHGSARPLPRRFWIYWLVVVLGVSMEWCMVFWGADFLENSVGFEKVAASTLMSVFLVAMVIGRAVGSQLTHSFDSSRLLSYAVVVVGVGFPVFWLARAAPLNVVGLFIAGLGIANLFPLTLAVATGIDPQQSNVAGARIALAGGVAILVAPQVLASFADQVGIFNAFGVMVVLVIAAAILIAVGRRIPVPAQAAQPEP